MKVRVVHFIFYFICCNAIMFIFCALPWYATIMVSKWYCILAIFGTVAASAVCHEMLIGFEEIPEDEKFNWKEFFEDD